MSRARLFLNVQVGVLLLEGRQQGVQEHSALRVNSDDEGKLLSAKRMQCDRAASGSRSLTVHPWSSQRTRSNEVLVSSAATHHA
jgi:hypothetical protein